MIISFEDDFGCFSNSITRVAETIYYFDILIGNRQKILDLFS